MKGFYFLLMIFLSACIVEHDKNSYELVKVIDGDTIIVLDSNNRKMHVRLIGINAPESRDFKQRKEEPFGKEASAFAEKLLKGKEVLLEFDRQREDKYGRTLAYVYTADSIFVNDSMLRAGYAEVMSIRPNVRYAVQFLNSERIARSRRLGIWSER